jgi:hypothetical protein
MQQKEHLYYTYIVASRTHVLYIGVTGSIELLYGNTRAGLTRDSQSNSTAIGLSGLNDMARLKLLLLVKSRSSVGRE